MEPDLSGRVVLVTGASRGIGLAVARALVAEGARVAICSRDEAAIAAVAAQLGDKATGLAADVRDDAAIAALRGPRGGGLRAPGRGRQQRRALRRPPGAGADR